MNDMFVVLISLIVVFILLIFTFIDAYRERNPFNGLRTGILYVLIPLVFCFSWTFLWGLGWNAWLAAVIFVYLLASVFLTLIIVASARWWSQQHVPAYATLSYLLQGGGWRERGVAIFYKIPQWSLPVEKKLTLLDSELLPDPIREKGESDTRWNGRCQIRKRYLEQRKEIAAWNISTFGYWTQGERRIRDRYKLLQFYHKYDPAEQGIMIGCVIEKKTRTYYRGRYLLTYIAWAGFPDDEITQKMSASETYLDVTANTEALQKAKILQAENLRLQDNVDDLIEALQFAKSGDEAVAAEISGKEPEERAGQPSYNTVLLKYYAKLAFGLIIALVIAIILLMHFGVI